VDVLHLGTITPSDAIVSVRARLPTSNAIHKGMLVPASAAWCADE